MLDLSQELWRYITPYTSTEQDLILTTPSSKTGHSVIYNKTSLFHLHTILYYRKPISE